MICIFLDLFLSRTNFFFSMVVITIIAAVFRLFLRQEKTITWWNSRKCSGLWLDRRPPSPKKLAGHTQSALATGGFNLLLFPSCDKKDDNRRGSQADKVRPRSITLVYRDKFDWSFFFFLERLRADRLWIFLWSQMGALKYVEELQKKKQSDVLRFLLRVRCWEVRSLEPWEFFLIIICHFFCSHIESLPGRWRGQKERKNVAGRLLLSPASSRNRGGNTLFFCYLTSSHLPGSGGRGTQKIRQRFYFFAVSCYTLVEHCWECINIASSTQCDPPCFPPFAPRQGSSSRLQGQAGLRYLPRPCPPWRTQEACP